MPLAVTKPLENNSRCFDRLLYKMLFALGSKYLRSLQCVARSTAPCSMHQEV
jgi:hypothetical protein